LGIAVLRLWREIPKLSGVPDACPYLTGIPDAEGEG